MVQQTTSGIQVSVETFYHAEHSNPVNSEFLFIYQITIENRGEHPVQLLSRRWVITDGNGIERVVEGEGVVGKQPVIHPYETYQYVSASNIKTEIGKMVGYYIMQNQADHNLLTVAIPEFQLIAPFKLN